VGMEQFHGTTIVSVRRGSQVVIAGDGQVTLGNTVMKANARKVRRLYKNKVLAGFAGATADAFTLFERFESKLEMHSGHLTRAAVELAKDWRTDRLLRRLEALLAVADREASLIIVQGRIWISEITSETERRPSTSSAAGPSAAAVTAKPSSSRVSVRASRSGSSSSTSRM